MSSPSPDEMLMQWISGLLDDALSEEELATLANALANDSSARELYYQQVQMHAQLAWSRDPSTNEASPLQEASPTEIVAPILVEDVTIVPFSPALEPRGTVRATLGNSLIYLSESAPFAYSVACILIGIGLLVGSAVYVSSPGSLARAPKSDPAYRQDQQKYVGRITGTADCLWANGTGKPTDGVGVPLGRTYSLVSGLIEITYDTGARVIVEGPASFNVDSANGGFLSVGRLTARMEKRVAGLAEADATKPDSLPPSSPLVPPAVPDLNSPVSTDASLFTVKTPTSTVTDFGTEFGVEVGKDRATTVVVFEGQVGVESRGSNESESHTQCLAAGEAMSTASPDKMVSDIAASLGKRFAQLRAMPSHAFKGVSGVLFHDTFQNPPEDPNADPVEIGERNVIGDDWGLNRERFGRQTGQLAPVWFIRGGFYQGSRVSAQVRGDGLLLFLDKCESSPGNGPAGWLVLDRDFPNDIEVSTLVAPLPCSDTSKDNMAEFDWLAMSVRGSTSEPDNRVLPAASNAGAVFAIQPCGRWAYSENGLQIASGDVPAANRYAVRMRASGDRLDVLVNDATLDLDPHRPATARTLPAEIGRPSNNYVGIGFYNTASQQQIRGLHASKWLHLQVIAVDSPNYAPQSANKSK